MASWESGMKVDPVAYASFGNYSEVYGAGEEGNIANLFASWGFIEDAPAVVIEVAKRLWDWFWEFF